MIGAGPPTILHVDLDAFYASVEQRDNPELRGKPVIVGGHEKRGVVCAASYEVRPFGVKSAMPMVEAMRLCPHAIVIPVRMARYAAVSEEFFGILHRHSPLVEGLSLDEAFLDVTGEERLLGDGQTIARSIKAAVQKELSLVASVGVAGCKLAAKIASDLRKPDGLVVVPPDGTREFLAPLPTWRLWGVGKVTEQHLLQRGIRTVGDIAATPPTMLASWLGRDAAAHLGALARGEDARHVEPDRAPVSMGHEDTFDHDLFDRTRLGEHLLSQADRACARLRDHGLRARTITVKVKYAQHERTTRRATLPRATSDGRVVGAWAVELLAEVPDVERRGVRLTGVSLSGLERAEATRQLTFDEPDVERGERLGTTLDEIRARFGTGMVKRAVHVDMGAEGGLGKNPSDRPARAPRKS
jgi:DNA polymerase-4